MAPLRGSLPRQIRSWRSQAGRIALQTGAQPRTPGPAGKIPSLARWVAQQPEGSGARLEAVELPPSLPLREARTVEPDAPLDRVLVQFATREKASVTPAARVAVLPRARLATYLGLVVSPNNDVFTETAWNERELDIAMARNRFLPRPVRVVGAHGTLVSQWCDGYFHWLTEALPRLEILRLAGYGHLPFVVPYPLAQFQVRSLELLGVPEARLTLYRQHLQPDMLVWPAPAGPLLHPPSWVCRWLRETYAGSELEPDPCERIYVSRRGAPRRYVVNESEVIAALQPYGFRAVDPVELSWVEQVRLFSRASTVVAAHGAGITNIVFSPRLRLIEMLDPHYLNPCYYVLADRSGHDYWYLLGETRGDGDIHVPIDKLVATVRAALASAD